MIFNSRNFGDFFHYILNGVNLEKIINTLHNAGKPFKAHTGVYILLLKLCVVTVAVIFKLTENIIPKFNISVALTAGTACGAAATIFFAAVKINFAARAAGTLAVFPEIIFLAEPYDMRWVNADFFCPYIKGFIVVFINCYPELICGHFKHLCAKFPSPRSGFMLKIIAEAEVAEHFKISTVAISFADSFNIRRADTFLAGGNSCARRLFLACEIFFMGAIPELISSKLLSLCGIKE